MVPHVFDNPEEALDCSSLKLDLSSVSGWAHGLVKAHGLHDGDRGSWRTSFGKTWALAWPQGPRVIVPCFRLEYRRIRRGLAGVQVHSVGILPVTHALSEEPAAEYEPFRLSEDESKVVSSAEEYLKVLQEASRKFMEDYAKAKKESANNIPSNA